jgi:hypothetical protein
LFDDRIFGAFSHDNPCRVVFCQRTTGFARIGVVTTVERVSDVNDIVIGLVGARRFGKRYISGVDSPPCDAHRRADHSRYMLAHGLPFSPPNGTYPVILSACLNRYRVAVLMVASPAQAEALMLG